MKKLLWIVALSALLIVSGCGKPPKTAGLIIAVDETESAGKARTEGAKVAKATASTLLDNREGIDCRIFAFGRQVRTLLDTIIAEEETILNKFGMIQDVPSPKKRGTYWSDMISELQRQCARSQAETLTLLIVTDGEVHDLNDPTANLALVKQIEALAKEPKIKLIAVGPLTSYGAVRENWRDTVERLFQSFDSDHRLIIYGQDDASTAMTRILEVQNR